MIDIILKLLDLFTAGSITYERAQALMAQLKTFKAENREPTPEEWQAMLDETTDLSTRLDSADKQLNS